MSKKIIINIGSLVGHMHVPDKYDEKAMRHKITKTLLQAVNDSQWLEEIEWPFKAKEPDDKKPISDEDDHEPVNHDYPETDEVFNDLPAAKKQKIEAWIGLINWAREHHDNYLYGRATDAMLDELFKQAA